MSPSPIKLYSYQEQYSKTLNEFLKGKITKENFISIFASFIKKRIFWTRKLILKIEKKNLSLKEILRRFFPEYFLNPNESYYPGLEFLWKKLIKKLKKNLSSKKSIEQINKIIDKNLNLEQLPSKMKAREAKTYQRTLFGLEKTLSGSGFEGIILHWKKDSKTPIHAHPNFAYYKILSGKCLMKFYKKKKNGSLVETSQKYLSTGDSLHSYEKKMTFTNLIHKVECIEEGFTLHLYSDNAIKGKIFE